MGTRWSRQSEPAQPSCSGSECLAPSDDAQHSTLDPAAAPWLSAAQRGATAYAVSSSVPNQTCSGSAQVARRRHRKRGSRGRGALSRRKQDRPRLVAAVGVEQRAAQRRSSSDSRLCDILVAIQTQGAAIESLAASVGRLAGAVHAQQRRRADSPTQRESGVDAQPDAQPDKQLVEHISQQLVQVQCLAKQTAEAQQRSQQTADTCAAELMAFHTKMIGHSTARQQIAQQMEVLDSRVDAVSQQLGVLMLERSERSQQVNVIQPADSADRQWRESTDDSILELHQSRYGLSHRVFKLEDRVDALSSNLDHFLGPFSR